MELGLIHQNKLILMVFNKYQQLLVNEDDSFFQGNMIHTFQHEPLLKTNKEVQVV